MTDATHETANRQRDSGTFSDPDRVAPADPWCNGGPYDLGSRNTMRMGTDRIRAALARGGNPESSFRIIMVGGTNGKTSTTHFIAQLLMRLELKVGTFSSPHPEDPALEVRVNGCPVDAGTIHELIPPYFDFEPRLTSFEIKVCVALELFRRQGVDVAVMEMGMGGLNDAVNVRRPDMAVITNVELDHTRHLGTTMEAIAANKGDIIPEYGLLVTSARSPGREVLERIAAERGAGVVTPSLEEYIPHLYHLMVEHHKENAALAMEAVLRFGFAFPGLFPRQVSTVTLLGLAKDLRPPAGRFQVVPLNGRVRMILDGAHNPAGFRALFGDLRTLFADGREQPLVVIMGILADKDIPAMVPHTRGVGAKFICLAPTAPEGRIGDPEFLARELGTLHGDVLVSRSMHEAIETGRLLLGDRGGIVLVTGSLYTVADAMGWLEARKRA